MHWLRTADFHGNHQFVHGNFYVASSMPNGYLAKFRLSMQNARVNLSKFRIRCPVKYASRIFHSEAIK